jgi:pimeloyl-ACP methyl ester carboxylesterase
MKRLAWLITIGLCLQLVFCSLVQAAPEEPLQVKELNLVFLHGAGGNACSFQLLADCLKEQLPTYTLAYEQANPGTKIRLNTLLRCYPNDVDIKTWAKNIADSINEHFPDRDNLILIGHSMGGKAALYAVAQNVDNLADKVAMVVTINSPIKSMQNYYIAGGGTALDYYRARWLISGWGVSDSVVHYDSSRDGRLVAETKHWLAFVSGESAPLSPQFDVGGIDALPRDMDDSIIPISAQYSEGADVVYYGEYSHNDFGTRSEVTDFMAEQILRYIFGGSIECSVFARGGSFEHKAGWLPGTDSWDEVVGEVLAASGSIQHWNESYTTWQEWNDVVGKNLPQAQRSSYQVSQVTHFPSLASVKEARWFLPDNPNSCLLYIRTRAAPRSHVQVNWSTYQCGLLPPGVKRDHYVVEITTGTPLTNIKQVSWVNDDPTDLRLRIYSEAAGPFRWFKANWRTYFKESRQRKVIDEIPAQALSETTPLGPRENKCCN